MSDPFASVVSELTGGRRKSRVIGDSPTATAAQQVLSAATAWQVSVQAAVPSTAPGTTGVIPGTGAPGAGYGVPNPNNPGFYMDGSPDTTDPTVPNAQGQMVPNPNYAGYGGGTIDPGAGSGGGGGGGGGGGDDGGGGLDSGGDSGDGGDALDDGGYGDDYGAAGGDFDQSADYADQGDAGLPPDLMMQLPEQGSLESTLPDSPDASALSLDDDSSSVDDVDTNDPYAVIMGELTGRERRELRRSRVLGEDKPAASAKASFFAKPLWSGSPVRVWQAMAGAGVAVALSTVLMLATRRKK